MGKKNKGKVKIKLPPVGDLLSEDERARAREVGRVAGQALDFGARVLRGLRDLGEADITITVSKKP